MNNNGAFLSRRRFETIVPTIFAVTLAAFLCNVQGQTQDDAQDIVERDPKAAAEREAKLVSGIRQLTFEGRRAGEGYFSRDGSQMVFQSEREPGNPFFQIYLMDLETGDLDRVSPGIGKTTCAWIHPDGDHVLFASTHEDEQARQKQAREIEVREKGEQRRYSWDYDEHYDLFVYDRHTKDYENLTSMRGYDAEGSWSPNGSLIAFASNRRAYSEPMSDELQKKFDLDPSIMMDIYVMPADGNRARRVTDVTGYDGGPFFAPDGQRICWRRFAENGATAEIFTMNTDGTDARQLTKLNTMAWAPFYHPSGEYLIFTTNRHGFGNFELYLVDVAGNSEPVRVTYTKGFDGLPVFTPDGDQLSWTTNRTASEQSQIFVADWNHDYARSLLGLGDGGKLAADRRDGQRPGHAGDAAAQRAADQAARQSVADYTADDVRRHVDYLCRDELAGRLTGTAGEILATAYVAAYFEKLNLVPAGDEGTWFQEFEFTAGVDLDDKNSLHANGTTYELDADWRPVSFSRNGKVEASPIVFAGYGISAPAAEGHEEYDSYVHLDVTDKWVLVFRYMPEQMTPERRQQLSRYASLRYKTMLVRDKGACGMIVVSGPNSKVNEQLVALRLDGTLSGSSVPVVTVTDRVAGQWMAAADKDLKALQDELDQGKLMMGFEIPDVRLGSDISIRKVKRKGRNVLARLPASNQPALETVVVGAHVDHLGSSASSSSLARGNEKDQIHYGADDNASGVAALLEIAEFLSNRKADGKFKPQRDLLFAAWSGEELGLLGASHFAKSFHITHAGHAGHSPTHHSSPHTPVEHAPKAQEEPSHGHPHAQATMEAHVDGHARAPVQEHAAAHAHDTPEHVEHAAHAKPQHDAPHGDAHHEHAAPTKPSHAPPEHSASPAAPDSNALYPSIAACLNMDMVGRLDKNLILQGIGSSSQWRSEIERRNAPLGLPIVLQEDSYLPTDASVFYLRGVPILSAFTGSHSDYHTPRDTPDKLNYQGAARVARFMGLVARSLTLRDEAPDYVAQTAPKEGQRRANLRAYLGTIPDYAEEAQGVKLSGVANDGPAAKAGLQSGDVIVELAGKKIENIYDYTYAIEALKIGQTVKITVARSGKRVTYEITPGSRE